MGEIVSLTVDFDWEEITELMFAASMYTGGADRGKPGNKMTLNNADRVGALWHFVRPYCEKLSKYQFRVDIKTGNGGLTKEAKKENAEIKKENEGVPAKEQKRKEKNPNNKDWKTGPVKIHRNVRDAMILVLLYRMDPSNPQQLEVLKREELAWPLARKLKAEKTIRKRLGLEAAPAHDDFPMDDEEDPRPESDGKKKEIAKSK